MNENERYDEGMQRRRDVLGEAYVDRATSRRTPDDTEFQALITRYAWGEIWTRPGLDTRTRRLLVLATTIALGRDEELLLHVRAALEGGVPKAEIVEVFLQSAIYCGVPAANHAFAIARDLFAAYPDA